MQETRDNQIFSRGIKELTLPPNPRWSTHTRVSLPCFTKEQVITKSFSISGTARFIQYTSFLSWGSHKLQELNKNLPITKTG